MFLFTTTTVINDLKDFTTGKDLVKVIDETETGLPARLQVKRLNNFFVDGIVSVYGSNTVEADVDYADVTEALSSLLVDESEDAEPIYRFKLYINSVGNVDPFYSNSLVFKGKPLYIEWNNEGLSESADEYVIAAIVKNGKKYLNNVCDAEILRFCVNTADADADAPVFEDIKVIVDADGKEKAVYGEDETAATSLCIVAVNEYQRISTVELENLKPATDGKDEHFKKLVDNSNDITYHQGTEGFGTYDHLIKDFRLPTGANLRWKRTMEDEMPAPGATYTEFVLHYCLKRGIMGLGAVGMLAKSLTTHVFWVNNAVAEDFLSLLNEALALQTSDETVTVLDAKTKEEFELAGAEADDTQTT